MVCWLLDSTRARKETKNSKSINYRSQKGALDVSERGGRRSVHAEELIIEGLYPKEPFFSEEEEEKKFPLRV